MGKRKGFKVLMPVKINERARNIQRLEFFIGVVIYTFAIFISSCVGYLVFTMVKNLVKRHI